MEETAAEQFTRMTGLVEYNFPLRDGMLARLVLPKDLKAEDVKRLEVFMYLICDESAASVPLALQVHSRPHSFKPLEAGDPDYCGVCGRPRSAGVHYSVVLGPQS